MSSRTRRAGAEDFPALPPLSEPPSLARPTGGFGAGEGGPTGEENPVTLTRETVLNNKFRLLKQLSAGDEETVYAGLHLGTGRRVQLSLLPPGLAIDSPAGERMLRAARAAGRVPHQNVLSVVDSGTDPEGRPFIVYEHFAGVSCVELVAQGPLSAQAAAEIMTQVLEGLHALHGRGVVHRQLRPENVLVERSEGALRVKLTGFGYAVVTGRGASVPDLPRGFSRYLAPEARRGTETAEPSLDIYAAGVLMRYLITGDTDPNAALDPNAARAIARATLEDPDERFVSAENFLSAVGLMIADDAGASEGAAAPDGLMADLRYLQQRRAREPAASGVSEASGRLELYPVLMMVEALYARLGADGWRELLAEAPDTEQLLPAAGKADHFLAQGVPMSVVVCMLAAADGLRGEGDLTWLAQIGEAMVKRGLARFCPQLPKQLTPDVLVDCVRVLWSSLARHGEVVVVEHLANSARIAIRDQAEPSLEICAVLASLLRAQLRALDPRGEVHVQACQALGDAADIYVLTWG